MRFLCIFVLSVFATFASAPTSSAQDYSSLLSGFNEGSLTPSDKRFLQTALAFEGHYNGLLDGAWGQISRRAFNTYARIEFGTAAENWHMAVLAFSLADRFSTDGWTVEYFEPLGLSFLFPALASTMDAPTENFVNWRHTTSSLAISVGVNSPQRTQSLHDFTSNWHERNDAPYSVRKPNLAITSATKLDGSNLYTRSNFVGGSWSTIMLSADRSDIGILNAVAASISVGPAQPIMFTEGGSIDVAIQKVIAVMNDGDGQNNAGTDSKPDPDGNQPSSGSGSGIFVSNDGHVLTNFHVIDGCRSIAVDGSDAEVLSKSDVFDLAILRTANDTDKAIAVFSERPARLNSDVTVVGYPYADLLSGLNVTRGAVSSLKGMGGDPTKMQITAPVQPGNSGGPVISADGKIVGVVVSRLVSNDVDDIPQNVNFAVRGEIAKLFLSQNGVEPEVRATGEPLASEDLAEQASGFTAFIECR